MKIVLLTPEQFDEFSDNHPLHSYFQSSRYANLMQSLNYDIKYYGFINDEKRLVGATLILEKKLIFGFKYAYAPRGFLIDYDNKDMINEVTEKFRLYLGKHKFVFLKIDPPVINNKRDKDGNIVPSPYTNDLIEHLQKIGYSYFGENKFFGTLKPRWNAILKVSGSSKTLFHNLDRSVKNKIRKANSRGVEVIKGTEKDIGVFYNFVAKKHYRNLDYYKKFQECFKDTFEIYFAKLNTEKYLRNIKSIYENEISNNEKINLEIQQAGLENNISNKLTNQKITSDRLLTIYKKELVTASQIYEKNPQGMIIGATSIIKEKNNSVALLIEGLDQSYNLLYPTFLLKWYIIEKYAKEGAIFFDLNAITGYFNDNNKFKGLNEMKLGFNADVVEYIGEFDLVINKTFYTLYRKTKMFHKKIRKQNK